MTESKTETLLSQKAYALHRGVSPPYICKLVKSGVLIMRAGKVVKELSDRVLDERSDVSLKVEDEENSQPDGTERNDSYKAARTEREIFSAKLRRLEFEAKSGKLIPECDVTERWLSIVGIIRIKLEAIPSRVAPQAAALTDARMVRDLLTKEINEVLRELGQKIRATKNGSQKGERTEC